MAGVAGLMYALLLNSAPSGSLGVLFELDVLTAVLLGGVAFNGGRGTIRGVVLGVLFLAVLQNGLILLNVPTSFGM
jgi:ribose/xylose/arabinose/galactoside ABC-type transport system permease subunit